MRLDHSSLSAKSAIRPVSRCVFDGFKPPPVERIGYQQQDTCQGGSESVSFLMKLRSRCQSLAVMRVASCKFCSSHYRDRSTTDLLGKCALAKSCALAKTVVCHGFACCHGCTTSSTTKHNLFMLPSRHCGSYPCSSQCAAAVRSAPQL